MMGRMRGGNNSWKREKGVMMEDELLTIRHRQCPDVCDMNGGTT